VSILFLLLWLGTYYTIIMINHKYPEVKYTPDCVQ